MSIEPVMTALRAGARESTARIYQRHGAIDPCLGVSYAQLNAMAKSLGTNHEAARQLWRAGIHEARVLAIKAADPAVVTRRELEEWLGDAADYIITGALGGLASRTPFALDLARAWSGADREWTASAGWNVLTELAMAGRLPVDDARRAIAVIQKNLARSKNRVRHAMNGALIAIGGSMPELRELALAAARAIGPVEVDHGETGCKTPDATEYIAKMAARRGGPALPQPRRTGGKKTTTPRA